jgi:hypothetical protein
LARLFLKGVISAPISQEIALAISKKRYRFQLRSGDENDKQILSGLKTLAEHVTLHRIT